MTHCPSCQAPCDAAAECPRCETRLEDIRAVQAEAAACRLEARRALARGELSAAQGWIDRTLFLHRTREGLATAALVALASRDYSRACQLWAQSRAVTQRESQVAPQER